MNIIRVERDGISIFSLSGRLDAFTAPQLRSRLRPQAQQPEARIIVDLCQVTLIDSTGLGELVSGLKLAREGGGDLKLAELSPAVAVIFDLTGLDRAFQILPSMEEAVAAFGD